MNCKLCGKEVTDSSRRKYCSEECRKKANIKNQMEHNKEAYKSFKLKKHTKNKPKMSLEKINKLARAAGLSYGEYVSRNHLY